MTNLEIAKLLRNVAIAYSIKSDQKYRFQIIAYQRAADAIANTTFELEELIKEDKLKALPGIGPSIQSHLVELYNTGKVKHFEEMLKGIPPSVFTLVEVPTFGPKKAIKLINKFSLDNPKTIINDLEKLAKKGEIAKLEGFGEKSEQDILRAIAEYRKGSGKTKRMALPFAFELAEKIVNYLKKSNYVIKAYPLGSLRRMVSTIGDVDIAVSTENPKEVISYFVEYSYKERVIEKGETTASILAAGGKQIDLMTQPPQSFGSLLQHFTGSKNHNIHLRDFALQKGLSLSEYGIKKRLPNGELKIEKFQTEESFYQALGLDWVPPEMREDTGEVELASQNKLPALVKLEDIKGDLHTHSDFPIEPSHDLGASSMREMVKKAESLGYEYLGFSEHNPSISQHTSQQIYNLLEKRKIIIDQINKSTKNVQVVNLLEVDILANGNIAIDDKSLTLVDAIIVSIHSSFNMNTKKMTERIIKGLSHPKAKILAHPTGRLLNERPGYDFDWDTLIEFIKTHNKALEINSWPNRLDLSDIRVRQAIENKVKLVINTDSHEVSQMEGMKFGVAVARRGWATKNDILNTLPYNKFIEWLEN